MEIPLLKANEIECRVQSVKEKGCVLLVYKDARVDMKILDEVFGVDGWQRTHTVVNNSLFCTVKIWSENRNCWIEKQDVGTESFTEKEKGQSSDSFKRACVNIGIGRELYSAPFIYIPLNQDEVKSREGKHYLNFGVEFTVKSIEYDKDRNISKIEIVDKKGAVRFPSRYEKPITIADAVNEMNNCKTEIEIKTCWSKYKQFQGVDTEFYKACAKIGKSLVKS